MPVQPRQTTAFYPALHPETSAEKSTGLSIDAEECSLHVADSALVGEIAGVGKFKVGKKQLTLHPDGPLDPFVRWMP